MHSLAPHYTRLLRLLAALACSSTLLACASAGLDARVESLLQQAAEEEPRVTPQLVALSDRVAGEMIGLEHRLKTRQSLTRKVVTLIGLDTTLSPSEVVIKDALRYTIRIEDSPPGAHVSAIHDVLAALEGSGHQVTQVKNYWPRGDNYSGVNCVLETPSGLLWELQFHTRASLDVKKGSRALYEELRLPSTAIERKRELFDAMTAPWERVHVPEGILQGEGLHPVEERRQFDRP